MKITDFAIKYRTSVVVLTVLLILGGLFSYLTIPKESQPSIEIPIIVITSIYPGASPDDIESLVTKPIEEEVQGVNGIKEIRSTSVEGVSSVVVEFNPDISMDEAYQKVRDKVDIAKTELPGEVEEPLVNEINVSEFPILTINLAADYSLARLKEEAEDLADELEAIPSVLEVAQVGGLEQEVQVNVDLNALKGYNLAFNDLIQTIQQENMTIPGGGLDVDRLKYSVRVSGEVQDPSQLEGLVVKAPEGRPIYLRDVAEVVMGYKDRSSYSRLKLLQTEDEDGNLIANPNPEYLQVVSLNVKKRSGENILETVEQIQGVLDGYPFPAGTQVVITGDQSEFVRDLVRDLENNIISGLIFVVAILLFFLGVRNALLVGIAIPLSMFISFIVFQALGYTLNFIILFSLIIALGMLVDNAIVIVENIYRYHEEGHSKFEAARLGTGEVGMAVVSSTATTVAAFLPMLFWPGIIGEFMSYMPLTLIITLSCSLFVALIINPVITGIFVKLEGEESAKRTRTARWIGLGAVVLTALVILLVNPITLLVLVVSGIALYYLHTRLFKKMGDRFIQHTLPNIVVRYRHFLRWMLERDYTVRRAFLRNTLTLGLLAAGFILLLLGLAIGSVAGQAASLVLVVPGGLMLALGIVGVLVHTLESLFLGGKASVKAGLVLGVLFLGLLSIIYVSPRPLSFTEMGNLMIPPLVIIAVGFLGVLFNRKRRTRLILTDNRARLMTGALGALFAIVGMFFVAPTGVEFFPTTDPRQIQVSVEAALGTNIEASNQIALTAQERIEALLGQNPASEANVKNALVGVGVGGDAAFGGGAASPEASQITLNMVDYAQRPEPSSRTMAQLRDELQGIPGTEIQVAQDQSGPPTGPPVNIEISGEDFDKIIEITQAIKARLIEASETGRIPGLVDISDNLNTGRPEFQVRIDRERAARFGLNTSQIAQTIRTAVNGTEASQYRTGEDEYDITVRLAEADRRNLEDLKNLTILDEGQQIPLVAVADFDIGGGLGSITRLDLQRVATVSGQASPGYNGNAILAQVQGYLAEYVEALPPGYTISYTGESEDQQESFGFLTTALLIGVALIFMILIAQFNSINAPFIIMVAVGLSLIGVLLGLILTRTAFGLFTFIGVISLAGIVVNNAIVLVDYSMQLRERGLSKKDAIVEAGATRLRPVLLTALTTVLGLIPLTFGINIDFVGLLTELDPAFQIGSENTQFWGPMGTAIISGLTFATFLTLVIVPVMYSMFDSVSVKLGTLFHGRSEPELAYAGAVGNGHVPPVATDGNGRPGPARPQEAESVQGS